MQAQLAVRIAFPEGSGPRARDVLGHQRAVDPVLLRAAAREHQRNENPHGSHRREPTVALDGPPEGLAAYSITSSARASSEGGTVSPSALAVLRLITSSNFVGCSIGMSPGLVPFKILSTKTAQRRHMSKISVA